MTGNPPLKRFLNYLGYSDTNEDNNAQEAPLSSFKEPSGECVKNATDDDGTNQCPLEISIKALEDNGLTVKVEHVSITNVAVSKTVDGHTSFITVQINGQATQADADNLRRRVALELK